ncbi:unnamed protein product [Hymenolepis diminuta]|uniref:DNMT1-RFD domain-containing protein n=1 Tax=Hymenolepis diminuta TaxID=6216 RepID=A0A0R3SCV8_HYMDI|nr:unnamed protein product [Hymenolepis diminuta]VUZ47572.1 unnamed protein product [Hymenolepis diminuta]
MAKDEEEKDVYLLELTIPPFENEFEEEQLRVDCEEALSKMPTHRVDSFEWRCLKKKVLIYKQYLRDKAEYLEDVIKDFSSSLEFHIKYLEVIDQLGKIEEGARTQRRTTVDQPLS